MTYKLYIWLMAAAWCGSAALAITGMPWQYPAGIAGAGLLILWLMYRSIHKPLEAVGNGVYLLREQDFSSRLRLTGQSDADKVVKLFNRLMDAMKSERLKQQEQTRLLGLLIEASPMGIAICDFDNKITSRNKAYTNLVHGALEAELLEMDDDEVRVIRTEGSQVCRCSKLWFMDSGFRRRFILVELMTEEIMRAEKRMFNKIVRTIGHEVNNTMGSVASVLETLKLMHGDDNDIVRTIESSTASCRNLAGFVSGYSSLVKLPEPVPEPVELNQMMEQMMPSLDALIGNNCSLTLNKSDGKCMVNLDTMLMQRVISNIVKNAAESIGAKEGGKIEITVKPRGMEITDNGAGISEEAARQLFTLFFSTKRPDRGLGLMLVADILRSHKATFTLSSDVATGLTTFAMQFRTT